MASLAFTPTPIPNLDLSNSKAKPTKSLKKGRIQAAFKILTEMDRRKFPVGPDIYGLLLQGCLYDRALFMGLQIHSRIVKHGDSLATNEMGFYREALMGLCEMIDSGILADNFVVPNILKACAAMQWITFGRGVHGYVVKMGFDSILGGSILNFYSKVGLIKDAELVFGMMLEKDAVAWNLLISSYVQYGQVEKALDLCHLMRLDNMRFDSVTLASILSACSIMGNIKLGKEGHCYCIRNNLVSDLAVANSMIDMYAKCEKIADARHIFNSTMKKDLLLWNTLLSAYAELGKIGEALKLFYGMQLESVPPNVMSWNAVILGFIRNGQINEAQDMFSHMQAVGIHPNLMTFTTLIYGLVQNGFGNEAILVFQKMQECGIRANLPIIISTISACTDVASLQYGRAIHGYILRHALLSPIPVATALADMYSKCGNMDQARRVLV
ncbi:hypothetical protein OIU78_002820 [Salix suchowensis]|nr:hypothetical protein OIU78_002820 [Salix suchowensis]